MPYVSRPGQALDMRASFHRERSDVLPLLKHHEHYHKVITEEHRDMFGKTIFKHIYGLDRLWILFFFVAGLGGPAARIYAQGYDWLMVADTSLVLALLCVTASIVRAVDSPIFIIMYVEKKYCRELHWFTKYSIMVNCLVALARPLVIIRFAQDGWSHLGGIFVFNVLFVILPYTRLTVDMWRMAADDVVKEIENSPDDGKWSRVLRKLMILRGDMQAFWQLGAGGGPWFFLILTEVGGAFAYGSRFLQEPEQKRWALCFFVWVFAFLLTLQPLARVTSKCASKSSYSKSIHAAATRWYFPTENKQISVPEEDYRAYQMAMAYLENCPMGVRIAGVVITNRLIASEAFRCLIAIPTLYRMVTSSIAAHHVVKTATTTAASLAAAYVQT